MIIDNKIFERADRIAAINPFKISFSFWGNKAERIYLIFSTVSPPGSPGCLANHTSGGSTSFLAEVLFPPGVGVILRSAPSARRCR